MSYRSRARTRTVARRVKITPAHRRTYLDALARGMNRGDAAREAHKDLTGTASRGIENREAKFAAQVADAERQGREERAHKIDGQFEKRAFDPDRPNLRALEILAATHHPDYAWLRRRGARSADGEELGLKAMIDPELLTRGQLLLLAELVRMGQGLIPNPELDAERRGLPSGDVVDGEAEEEAA